ncbi:MAG: chorismate synthase [Bacteroidales bacterium]|nr:chorismate synthase [Bacteroidales bacterium]
MGGNTFGKAFRLVTFGESHGPAIGGVIEGCPAGLTLDMDAIQHELDRRRPGQSELVSARKEADRVEFLSGITRGITLGTPIGFIIRNRDQRPEDYDHLKDVYRPSHADYTYEAKYGIRDPLGGGRASARETLSRVVGGAVARQIVAGERITVTAFVSRIGDIMMPEIPEHVSPEEIDRSPVRCPDPGTSEKMIVLIRKTMESGDTLGGIIVCIIRNVIPGLGEPVFDKLHADLGKAMLSINAVKGFETGSGFGAAQMTGSRHNDPFEFREGKISTLSNYSGGIQGGISNGQDIMMRVAFKPVATLMRDQKGISRDGKEVLIRGKGRHDVTVLPRAVPIVEAMACLVLADHLQRNRLARYRQY